MIKFLQPAHLYTLIAIAEEGSYEAAAQKIGRTQSAVTQQMLRLEEMVGSPLFRTQGRRRVLTQAGTTLVKYGHELLSLSHHAIIAVDKARTSNVIRIGAPQEIAERILPDILASYSKDNPTVRISIHVDRSPILMTMLSENRLDLTLSTRKNDIMKSQLVTSLPALWIAAPEFKYVPRMPVPLVLADDPSLFRQIALSALGLNGIPFVERVTSPTLAGIRLAIAGDLGVTVRTESSFFQKTQILGDEHGLPPLPLVNYYIVSSQKKPTTHIKELYNLIASVPSFQQ
ncbi:MAG: LysR family transcriptional regulator [Maribacter sp.]|nr:MAG: LysR family transcriptional regulator [Maribacter sp.]